MSAKQPQIIKNKASFPTASEFIITLASWNLDAIINIFDKLSIINHYNIDESNHSKPIQSKTNSNNKWHITTISPLLFRSSIAKTLKKLLIKHSSNTNILELDDLDLLLDPYNKFNITNDKNIKHFIIFLLYTRYFHSHIQNPYLSSKYDTILDDFDKNSVSTYFLDISGNFKPFVSLLLNHQIRF
eukprot:433660_1